MTDALNNCMQTWNPPVKQAMTTTGGVGTVGNITYWPWDAYPPATVVYPSYTYVTQSPTECCGDVHVFPCPHCDKCKCGAATVKRRK